MSGAEFITIVAGLLLLLALVRPRKSFYERNVTRFYNGRRKDPRSWR